MTLSRRGHLNSRKGFRPIQATGGVVSEITVAGVRYRLHSFLAMGTHSFVVLDPGSEGLINYLVVGGGGGGGAAHAGGGGGGGVVMATAVPISVGSHSLVVGAGGIGPYGTMQAGSDGQVSSFLGEEVGGGRLTGQGDGRQGQRPAALAQGDVGGAGFADADKGHQRKDLSAHQGQDRGGVAVQLRWCHRHQWATAHGCGQPSMGVCQAGQGQSWEGASAPTRELLAQGRDGLLLGPLHRHGADLQPLGRSPQRQAFEDGEPECCGLGGRQLIHQLLQRQAMDALADGRLGFWSGQLIE